MFIEIGRDKVYLEYEYIGGAKGRQFDSIRFVDAEQGWSVAEVNDRTLMIGERFVAFRGRSDSYPGRMRMVPLSRVFQIVIDDREIGR